MKKTKFSVKQMSVLIALCFVFGGCPYETKVPLDAPSLKINSKLLGTWEDHKNKNETYKVSEQDPFTYSIAKTQKDTKKIDKYHAYASVINKTTFLNVWNANQNENTHPFVLYKMEVKNENLIVLTEVTENIDEQFSSSAELKKFVTANMKNSYFFSKEETNLIRASGKQQIDMH